MLNREQKKILANLNAEELNEIIHTAKETVKKRNDAKTVQAWEELRKAAEHYNEVCTESENDTLFFQDEHGEEYILSFDPYHPGKCTGKNWRYCSL